MQDNDEVLGRLRSFEDRLLKLENVVGKISDFGRELLQELVNTGAVFEPNMTHRDLVAPKVQDLLKQRKFEELEKFLAEYHARLKAID